MLIRIRTGKKWIRIRIQVMDISLKFNDFLTKQNCQSKKVFFRFWFIFCPLDPDLCIRIFLRIRILSTAVSPHNCDNNISKHVKKLNTVLLLTKKIRGPHDVYIYIFTFLTNMTKNSEYPFATSKQINPS